MEFKGLELKWGDKNRHKAQTVAEAPHKKSKKAKQRSQLQNS